MRVLIIDNYDSFTYNLVQLVARVTGRRPTVVTNDECAWTAMPTEDFDALVVSPGPGRPERPGDVGSGRDAVVDGSLPILGVCLGHQMIGHLFGARVDYAPDPVHGSIERVHHDRDGVFAGLPSPFDAVCYHSLAVTEVRSPLECTAWTEDGVVMALRHRQRPLWGVQFHPESICTKFGELLIGNFLTLADEARSERPPKRPRTAPRMSREPPIAAQRPSRFALESRRLPHTVDDEALFRALFGRSTTAFWLDSSAVLPGYSRFSVMGDARGPHAELVTAHLSNGEVRVRSPGGTTVVESDIFDYLRSQLDERHIERGPSPCEFELGYVGYLGYELKAVCGASAAHASSLPDASLVFSDRAVVIDHVRDETWLLCLVDRHGTGGEAENWFRAVTRCIDGLAIRPVQRAASMLAAPPSVLRAELPPHYRLAYQRDEYMDLVRACQREITEGDSYEICLTNRVGVARQIDPLETYSSLRSLNPAPYAAFLRFPWAAVLSSSPERFLQVSHDGWVESKPIKGTRPRASAPADDRTLRDELAGSRNDLAENLMIVDLVRNDLGRVCDLGSVHVPTLFGVETFATVHQLVSTIRGRLRRDCSAVDAIVASFPGGSMTGAPKRRTMEIIDRMEGRPRGVYSGALGYLSLNGSADLSIVIRTIEATNEGASFGVGGAITMLSDAEAEFEETLVKARALIAALESSGGCTLAALEHRPGRAERGRGPAELSESVRDGGVG